ncbi:hypothetical protein KKH03_01060 [Patescibacteria group bacterium]|nr:hypothetical protein [Patescibacteria group bacterium]
MLQNIIENIGLTKKEAQIYLAALEIGSNPVSKIAVKAKLNRVTTYDIIEKLAKRGLVSSFTKAKVKYYTATDPELVVNDFKKKVEDMETALPVLKQMNGEAENKPKVMSYESIEAIKTIFKDALATDGEILVCANIKELETHWPTFIMDFEKKRMEYELPERLIAINDSRGRFMREYDDEFQRTTRLTSGEQSFKGTTIIYGTKVAMISFAAQTGILIEDPEISETQKALFEMNWKTLTDDLTNPKPNMTVRKVGGIKPAETKVPPALTDQVSLF